MGLLDRLRGDDEERDERDWRERRGRYEGLDPDTPDRPQVKPVQRRDIPASLTHHIGPDGIRVREADEGGRWRPGGDDGD